MRKFIKYEIKGTYKFMLGIISVILIISTTLQLQISKFVFQGNITESQFNSGLPISFFGVIAIGGLLIAATVYIINTYKKELDDDRGYLTFTLPLTGNQILGSKILVAIFWQLLLVITISLFNLGLASIIFGNDFQQLFEMLKIIARDSSMVVFAISNLISISLTITLAYFSITVSRITFKNRRFGGLWFVLFIALNLLMTYIILKLSIALPYYLNMTNFTVNNISNLTSIIPFENNAELIVNSVPNTLLFLGTDMNPYLNIVGFVSHIIVLVVGFLGTGYLLENKINL